MDSPGCELAAGSDPQATAEKEGWAEVSHCLLAGGGESRRPKAVCNPGSGASITNKKGAPKGSSRILVCGNRYGSNRNAMISA